MSEVNDIGIEDIKSMMKYMFSVELQEWQITAIQNIINRGRDYVMLSVPVRMRKSNIISLEKALEDIKAHQTLEITITDKCGYCGEEHRGQCLNTKKPK